MGNFEGALRCFTCNHSHYTTSTDEKFKVHYIGPFQKAQDASISIDQESAEEPANLIFSSNNNISILEYCIRDSNNISSLEYCIRDSIRLEKDDFLI